MPYIGRQFSQHGGWKAICLHRRIGSAPGSERHGIKKSQKLEGIKQNNNESIWLGYQKAASISNPNSGGESTTPEESSRIRGEVPSSIPPLCPRNHLRQEKFLFRIKIFRVNIY